jgi:hypothetical protein
LKYVDKENPEYAPLAKAYEEIKNVVDQVNKRAQQEEDVHKVMDLQSAVELVHGPEVRGPHTHPHGPTPNKTGVSMALAGCSAPGVQIL